MNAMFTDLGAIEFVESDMADMFEADGECLIPPQYERVIRLAHSANALREALLELCGRIEAVHGSNAKNAPDATLAIGLRMATKALITALPTPDGSA